MIEELAAAGHKHLFVQPIGFVCDHVEVLYDIDIAFKNFAAAKGITLSRAESLNDSVLFAQAVAQLARTAAGGVKRQVSRFQSFNVSRLEAKAKQPISGADGVCWF